MVIGLELGNSDPTKSETFKDVLKGIKEISKRFRDKNSKIKCIDLIGVEVFTEDGLEEFKRNNTKEKLCSGLVFETVKMLEEILSLK